MRFNKLFYLFAFITITNLSNNCFCQTTDTIFPQYSITLKEAHIGSLEIDTMLLNSYGNVPSNIKEFYIESRSIFKAANVDFTNNSIVKAALNNDVRLLGGPLLGDLTSEGVRIWLRPASIQELTIKVKEEGCKKEHFFTVNPDVSGKQQSVVVKGLSSNTKYNYQIVSNDALLSEGSFTTAPKNRTKKQVRIAFGSCFHKIGLHNPNLINTILERSPHAMMLLGDIAVDDRENNFSMHRSDYLLRDVSPAWKKLSANIPLYTSWDDHDYLNNDLSGVPKRFTNKERDVLRKVWEENWNNPQNQLEGIYFNTRIGDVEIIMLDTRSCRTVNKRGEYGSYLEAEQLDWLKNVLENSTASYKIISSGTMWSDYITNGKDSWGTWDILAREEIFNFIEKENISGVLLISGDRHGARGFIIPRDSGFKFYEFEAASLGGVPGPNAWAKDTKNQLFGYKGAGLKAFGELTFNAEKQNSSVTFRLINEYGEIMEEHTLTYEELSPKGQ
ncbi:alkaline phosphatase D family protein [Saccharicrinis aurantiacus]|uniref:alkaline phosphatase D family protein n=1 Tax=Saccharicrinis aurantiacus TaxID=1849719 RepID=UPI002491D214|nr:alkaline phosphatase D family protein [Saccharicrinis aurantiacus]